MAQFEKGDLVKVIATGEIARVQEVCADGRIRIQYVNHSYGTTVEAVELVDEYDYERESGHYGLTPKGIKPLQETK